MISGLRTLGRALRDTCVVVALSGPSTMTNELGHERLRGLLARRPVVYWRGQPNPNPMNSTGHDQPTTSIQPRPHIQPAGMAGPSQPRATTGGRKRPQKEGSGAAADAATATDVGLPLPSTAAASSQAMVLRKLCQVGWACRQGLWGGGSVSADRRGRTYHHDHPTE